MASSVGSDECSNNSQNQGSDNNGEEIEEILVYPQGANSGKPLVSRAKLSSGFKQHLKNLEENLCPGTFSICLWHKLQTFSQNVLKKRGNRGKLLVSNDIAVNSADIEIAWNVAAALGHKYFQLKGPSDWIPIYYYLMTLILEAKLKCLSAPCPDINKEDETILNYINEVIKLLRFNKLMMEELVHRYLLLNEKD